MRHVDQVLEQFIKIHSRTHARLGKRLDSDEYHLDGLRVR